MECMLLPSMTASPKEDAGPGRDLLVNFLVQFLPPLVLAHHPDSMRLNTQTQRSRVPCVSHIGHAAATKHDGDRGAIGVEDGTATSE